MREITERVKAGYLPERGLASIIDGIPGANLVGYWPALHGHGATLLDRSQNANTGTITGASWQRLPSGLWALSFNGVANRVNLGAGTSLAIVGSLTLEAWIKPTDATPAATQFCLAKWRDTGGDIRSYALALLTSGKCAVFASLLGTGATECNRASNTAITEVWSHIVGVYNTVGPTLVMYTNGALDTGTLTGTIPASVYSSAEPLLMGLRDSVGLVQAFAGSIALARVHSEALSAAAILRHYTRERLLFGV